MPEKAAAVNAPQRLIPEYQKIKATAVTNTPYQSRAIQPTRPIADSSFMGCSNAAGIRHRIRVIVETIAVCTIGSKGFYKKIVKKITDYIISEIYMNSIFLYTFLEHA